LKTPTGFRQSYMTQCPSLFRPISYYTIVFICSYFR